MHQILREELEWDEVVASLASPSARLLSVSSRLGDSRVYALGDKVFKIRPKGIFIPRGVLDLEHERDIWKLAGYDVDYATLGEWECLILPRLPGKPLDRILRNLSMRQRTDVILRLFHELNRLHANNIAHCDIRSDNVILTGDMIPRLVDFGRAHEGSNLSVTISDLLGLHRDGVIEYPYWKFALFLLFPKAQALALRARAILGVNRRMMPSDPIDDDLQMLQEAWNIAAKSSANSPGKKVAYYAFTYRRWHFLGERPWYLRWELIRKNVDFRGKKVLELGSNMGLFSCFAKLHGAELAIGIDNDPDIIRSAMLIASALDAGAEFRHVDLIRDAKWEKQLGGFDMVVATSLLHWLPNKERVLSFIGDHKQAIYEGHDELSIEKHRLKSAGFSNFNVLGQSERGRHIILATK